MRSIFFAILASILLLQTPANAATRKAPPLKEMGGQEITTPYFDITIPKGWSMPMPVQNMPQEGITAMFADMRGDPAVTVSVMKSDMPPKEIAEQTLANMKKGGIKSTELTEVDGLYCSNLSAKVMGRICFGSADGTRSVINIVGKNTDRADALLEAIKPKAEGLFPKKAQ